MQTLRHLIIIAAVLIACAGAATADQHASQQYETLLAPLVKGGADVLGEPLAYPDGPVEITSAIVTLAPGAETGWHIHEVPLFAYILEGELTVDYGEKGTRTYSAGVGFFEAINWPHNGTNTGTVPVRLIAVYMGGGDRANTEPVSAP
jgi:quercetin dioxygenase-like cupin family protein